MDERSLMERAVSRSSHTNAFVDIYVEKIGLVVMLACLFMIFKSVIHDKTILQV